MKHLVYPTPCKLSADSSLGLRRTTRPAHQQPGDYADKFDDETLFYDVFKSPDGSMAVCVGPPLLNLKSALAEQQSFFKASGLNAPNLLVELDRCMEFWIDIETMGALDALTLEGQGYELSLEIGANFSAWFSGKRVLMTKSKDNELQWIYDWALFHVIHHGADAVLLHDNGSTKYLREQLLETLASVPGVQVAVVVAWDFPYGPTGGAANIWDSDFCQYGMLQHARWRFLAEAQSVLNCDIDELVLGQGGSSVFALCEQSLEGYLTFGGRWIHCHDEGYGRPLTHRDHKYLHAGEARCPQKWATVPSRTPEDCQWRVHDISGMTQPTSIEGFCYRHFRQVNTSWKWNRNIKSKFQPSNHFLDEDMAKAFHGL